MLFIDKLKDKLDSWLDSVVTFIRELRSYKK
jgi:hypothetical protein